MSASYIDMPHFTIRQWNQHKGPCAALVLCGRAVLSERVKTIHELQAARKHWENDDSQLVWIPSSTRFGRSFVYLGTSSCFVVDILVSDYQKLPITGKQGTFAVAKQWRCTGPFNLKHARFHQSNVFHMFDWPMRGRHSTTCLDLIWFLLQMWMETKESLQIEEMKSDTCCIKNKFDTSYNLL